MKRKPSYETDQHPSDPQPHFWHAPQARNLSQNNTYSFLNFEQPSKGVQFLAAKDKLGNGTQGRKIESSNQVYSRSLKAFQFGIVDALNKEAKSKPEQPFVQENNLRANTFKIQQIIQQLGNPQNTYAQGVKADERGQEFERAATKGESNLSKTENIVLEDLNTQINDKLNEQGTQASSTSKIEMAQQPQEHKKIQFILPQKKKSTHNIHNKQSGCSKSRSPEIKKRQQQQQSQQQVRQTSLEKQKKQLNQENLNKNEDIILEINKNQEPKKKVKKRAVIMKSAAQIKGKDKLLKGTNSNQQAGNVLGLEAEHAKEIELLIRKNAQKKILYLRLVEQQMKKQEEIEGKVKSKIEEEKRKILNEQIRKDNQLKFSKIPKKDESNQLKETISMQSLLNTQSMQKQSQQTQNSEKFQIHKQIFQQQQQLINPLGQQKLLQQQQQQPQLISVSQQQQQQYHISQPIQNINQRHSQSASHLRNRLSFQGNSTTYEMDGTVKSSKEIEEIEKREKKRREEMGLSFLNNLNESFIRKKVEEEKLKQEGISNIKFHDEAALKKKGTISHEEIQMFMQQKKRKMDQEFRRRSEMEREKQERLKSNLLSLDFEIKRHHSQHQLLQQQQQYHNPPGLHEKDLKDNKNPSKLKATGSLQQSKKRQSRTASTPNLEKFIKMQQNISVGSDEKPQMVQTLKQTHHCQSQQLDGEISQRGGYEQPISDRQQEVILENHYYSQKPKQSRNPSNSMRVSRKQSNSQHEPFEMLSQEFKKLFNLTAANSIDSTMPLLPLEAHSLTYNQSHNSHINNVNTNLGQNHKNPRIIKKDNENNNASHLKQKSMSLHCSASFKQAIQQLSEAPLQHIPPQSSNRTSRDQISKRSSKNSAFAGNSGLSHSPEHSPMVPSNSGATITSGQPDMWAKKQQLQDMYKQINKRMELIKQVAKCDQSNQIQGIDGKNSGNIGINHLNNSNQANSANQHSQLSQQMNGKHPPNHHLLFHLASTNLTPKLVDFQQNYFNSQNTPKAVTAQSSSKTSIHNSSQRQTLKAPPIQEELEEDEQGIVVKHKNQRFDNQKMQSVSIEQPKIFINSLENKVDVPIQRNDLPNINEEQRRTPPVQVLVDELALPNNLKEDSQRNRIEIPGNSLSQKIPIASSGIPIISNSEQKQNRLVPLEHLEQQQPQPILITPKYQHKNCIFPEEVNPINNHTNTMDEEEKTQSDPYTEQQKLSYHPADPLAPVSLLFKQTVQSRQEITQPTIPAQYLAEDTANERPNGNSNNRYADIRENSSNLEKEQESQQSMRLGGSYENKEDNEKKTLSHEKSTFLKESQNSQTIEQQGQLGQQEIKKEQLQQDDSEIMECLYELGWEQLEELKLMLMNGDQNDEQVMYLTEQVVICDTAAVIIQKVFRGYLTRKYIRAIFENQLLEEEEDERLFNQAEKHLEESHIEPEELLEGFSIPMKNEHQQKQLDYEFDDQITLRRRQSDGGQEIDQGYDKTSSYQEEKQFEGNSQHEKHSRMIMMDANEDMSLREFEAHTPQPSSSQESSKIANISKNSEEERLKDQMKILREEQAEKWKEMVLQLSKLQSDGQSTLSEQALEFLSLLKAQSEMNQQKLIKVSPIAQGEIAVPTKLPGIGQNSGTIGATKEQTKNKRGLLLNIEEIEKQYNLSQRPIKRFTPEMKHLTDQESCFQEFALERKNELNQHSSSEPTDLYCKNQNKITENQDIQFNQQEEQQNNQQNYPEQLSQKDDDEQIDSQQFKQPYSQGANTSEIKNTDSFDGKQTQLLSEIVQENKSEEIFQEKLVMRPEDRAVLQQHTQHANSCIHELHHHKDNIQYQEQQQQQSIVCSAPIITSQLEPFKQKQLCVSPKSTLSQSSSVCFFERQPFQEFTQKVLSVNDQQVSQNQQQLPQKNQLSQFQESFNSLDDVIKQREQAIDEKHNSQMHLIARMHQNQRISPTSFQRKTLQLEKWKVKEKMNLSNARTEIERGYQQFALTIKQTKRDVDFVEQAKKIDTSKLLLSTEEDQLRRMLSLRTMESDHSIEEIGIINNSNNNKDEMERKSPQVQNNIARSSQSDMQIIQHLAEVDRSKDKIQIINSYQQQLTVQQQEIQKDQLDKNINQVKNNQNKQEKHSKDNDKSAQECSENRRIESGVLQQQKQEQHLQFEPILQQQYQSEQSHIRFHDAFHIDDWGSSASEGVYSKNWRDGPSPSCSEDINDFLTAQKNNAENDSVREQLGETNSVSQHPKESNGGINLHQSEQGMLLGATLEGSQLFSLSSNSKQDWQMKTPATEERRISEKVDSSSHQGIQSLSSEQENQNEQQISQKRQKSLARSDMLEELLEKPEVAPAERKIGLQTTKQQQEQLLSTNSAKVETLLSQREITKGSDLIGDGILAKIKTEGIPYTENQLISDQGLQCLTAPCIESNTSENGIEDNQKQIDKRNEINGKKQAKEQQKQLFENNHEGENIQMLENKQENGDKKISNNTEEEEDGQVLTEDQLCLAGSQFVPQNSTPCPGLECATLNFIKDYLVSFAEFIKDNFTEEFLERVNIPLGMEPNEFLKTFAISESFDSSNGEITAAPIYPIIKYINVQPPVVSEELFAHFNELFNREREDQQLSEDLQLMENYHMKMIYDCFNESLDSMRPFGLRGKPLPWKINTNKLSSIIINTDNMERILGLAIAKVLKWGSFLCGFIPERIESPTGEIIQIDEAYLNQIKEDRLAQMLENDVVENEDKWLLYEDEETDVQLEISDEIFNNLIEEFAAELEAISNDNDKDSSNNQSVTTNNNTTLQDNKPSEDPLNNQIPNNSASQVVASMIFGAGTVEKQSFKGAIRPSHSIILIPAETNDTQEIDKQAVLRNLLHGTSFKTNNSSNNKNSSKSNDQLNSSF